MPQSQECLRILRHSWYRERVPTQHIGLANEVLSGVECCRHVFSFRGPRCKNEVLRSSSHDLITDRNCAVDPNAVHYGVKLSPSSFNNLTRATLWIMVIDGHVCAIVLYQVKALAG